MVKINVGCEKTRTYVRVKDIRMYTYMLFGLLSKCVVRIRIRTSCRTCACMIHPGDSFSHLDNYMNIISICLAQRHYKRLNTNSNDVATASNDLVAKPCSRLSRLMR